MFQNGNTPLLNAAMYGYLPVVEYLVERGADMEAQDKVIDDVSFTHTSHINT